MIIVFPAKNLVKLQPARIAKGDRNLFSKLKGPAAVNYCPKLGPFLPIMYLIIFSTKLNPCGHLLSVKRVF